MNTQNNQRRQTILPMIIATIILLGASVSIFAQAGAGKPFDARDPQSCGNLKGGAPTQAKALNSFICHEERVDGNYLHLVENASLQLGAGRPYNRNEDYNVGNIDATAKVYPIRGSFQEYICTPPSDYMKNRGRNCSTNEHQKATGLCYKDGFGDWLCSMGDVNFKTIDTEAAPPGGTKNTAENQQAAPKKNNPAPRNNKNTTNKNTIAKTEDEKTDDGSPSTDFSELEKYVDVIRYEFGDNVTDHNMYIVVKSKTNNLPAFCVQFLDRDGIMVDPADSSCGTGLHMGYSSPSAGQTAKFDVNMPPEKDMKRVVSVRIVRQ